MIDALEIDRLFSPELKSIKAAAKRFAHPQISPDIILHADNIQAQIAKWTASPNSEAQAAE
jgi:hypothetical protein